MTEKEQTTSKTKQSPGTSENYDDEIWMIRPCGIYAEEYKDCISKSGRKHQLYTVGFETDCSKWKEDAENCEKFFQYDDREAMEKIIANEKYRQSERLKSSFNNNTWEYRDSPPPDWNKPIPGWEKKDSLLQEDKPESSCSIL